jgi:hypothetical protein
VIGCRRNFCRKNKNFVFVLAIHRQIIELGGRTGADYLVPAVEQFE